MKRLTDEDLNRMETEEKRATLGPWKAYRTQLPRSEAGKTQGIKADLFETQIGTEADHPQLKGPAPIVILAFSPYFNPGHHIHIDEGNAEFIANSRQNVPALLAEVRALKKEIKALKEGWENR